MIFLRQQILCVSAVAADESLGCFKVSTVAFPDKKHRATEFAPVIVLFSEIAVEYSSTR
jgi:hypothetical protein